LRLQHLRRTRNTLPKHRRLRGNNLRRDTAPLRRRRRVGHLSRSTRHHRSSRSMRPSNTRRSLLHCNPLRRNIRRSHSMLRHNMPLRRLAYLLGQRRFLRRFLPLGQRSSPRDPRRQRGW